MHLRTAIHLHLLVVLAAQPLFAASPTGEPYRHLVAEPLSEKAKMAIAMRMCYISKSDTARFVRMKRAVSSAACTGGLAAGFPCENVDLMSVVSLEDLGSSFGSDLWGWTDPETGHEIIIYNTREGAAFVDVTDPESPVHLGTLPVPGQLPAQGDVKVYRDHAYIVGESARDHGMQVFDLRRLRDVTDPPETFTVDAHYRLFGRAHNLAINEESGFAFGVSTTNCGDGLHAIDIRSPLEPTFAGCVEELGFVHDAQCVNYRGPDRDHQGREICFNSGGASLSIHDVTAKRSPVVLAEIDYVGRGFVHQGWLTEDQTYFLVDDEGDEFENGHNTKTYIFDVSDLDRPFFVAAHTSASPSVDHNLYITGDYVFEANYAAGMRVLKIDDLASGRLTEVGYFDVIPDSDEAQFGGAWSAYPYFKSGNVVISTISQGLFVVRPNFDFGPPCHLPLGHPNYCLECAPCYPAQGGCKNDDDCFGRLLCAENFGPQFGLGVNVDVCVEPRSVELEYLAARVPALADGGASLDRIHARAINNRGQVAGWAASADGSTRRAFLFTPGLGMETLAVPGQQSAEALTINDAGDVFGRLVRVRGNGVVQTGLFRYRDGEGVDLLAKGSNPSIRHNFEIIDVNGAGDVVGVLHRKREPRMAPYLYTEGEGWIHLGALDARLRERSVRPVAINDAADVLFTTVAAPSGLQEAYLLRGGDELLTLGNFGRRVNAPSGFNAKSQIVGYSETGAGNPHAYSVKPGRALVDLHRGRFTSSVAGWVNSRGIVGGTFDDEALFTYDQRRTQKVRVVAPRGVFEDLLASGAEFQRIEVIDMNERLEFVGRVVGRLDGQDVVRFFYFSQAAGVRDLGEEVAGAGLGGTLAEVTAINDRGAILLRLDDGGSTGALVFSPMRR